MRRVTSCRKKTLPDPLLNTTLVTAGLSTKPVHLNSLPQVDGADCGNVWHRRRFDGRSCGAGAAAGMSHLLTIDASEHTVACGDSCLQKTVHMLLFIQSHSR